jgi:hypothetical protein
MASCAMKQEEPRLACLGVHRTHFFGSRIKVHSFYRFTAATDHLQIHTCPKLMCLVAQNTEHRTGEPGDSGAE